MSDIRDEQGNDATYWPITNLAAGEYSNTRIFLIDTPLLGFLYSNDDPKARVLVTCVAAGLVDEDIGAGMIDLSIINLGPDTEFSIRVRAEEPIVGLYRVPLTVAVGSSTPAGWVVV